MLLRRTSWLAATVLLLLGLTHADTAAFDLPGPRIDVRVTRGDKTLPISQVPNLQPGDRLWLHADLPADQSAHYLMIAAFLRGSTNPPPEKWFIKEDTWRKSARQEGMVITVPSDAQQALLFLAPESGGDFGSLRSAVQGRPGAFVRASQDLNRASLDRTRLDAYLKAVQATSDFDPKDLQERSTLLARSLGIKLDQQCFDKPTEQQAPCLSQNTDQLVLDDGHSQSMVAALTSGASADLVGQLATTPTFGAGSYSPYIGAIVDVAKLLTSFRNPQYQFIPALTLPAHDHLDLRLNNAPSFRKPLSVIVVGLPPVESAKLPPLRPSDAKQVACLQKPGLVLSVEGAPLVYSTKMAHDFVLRVHDTSGKPLELAATPDPAQGGFVVDAGAAKPGTIPASLNGQIEGWWGFQRFEGPSFHLQSSHTAEWSLAAADKNALIVGRDDSLQLISETAACVSEVTAGDARGTKLHAEWKLDKPNQGTVHIAMKDASPGPVTLSLKQWKLDTAKTVALHAYSELGHLNALTLHEDDGYAMLTGSRLDEVAGVHIGDRELTPQSLTRADNQDQLRLQSSNGAPAQWHTGQSLVAHVTLKDGRTQDLPFKVADPRPRVTLLGKSVQRPSPAAGPQIQLAGQDELPSDSRLTFFLKADTPESFAHGEKIEISTADDAFHASLSESDGSITLQDAHVMYVVFDPHKSFGSGAFGPVRLRAVSADGVAGDWQPLADLVRLPSISAVQCPHSGDKACTLSGSNLFLIDSIAADPAFGQPVVVSAGFLQSSLEVPRPVDGKLFIKLRDNPSAVNQLQLGNETPTTAAAR